jgi:hypothetical protein
MPPSPGQLFTFLLAGYETTSLALSYALYLLAQHPHHQQLIMEASAGGSGWVCVSERGGSGCGEADHHSDSVCH